MEGPGGTREWMQLPESAPDATAEEEHRGAADEHDAPLKLCLTCSVETRTHGEFCPHCGASYLHKRRRLSRRAKWIAAATALAVVLVGAGTAIVLKERHDDQVREERAQKAEEAIEARRAAAAAAAARRAAEDEQRRLEIAARQDVVDELEVSVKRTAQRAVDDGALSGPILTAECQVVSGGGPEDLERDRGRFECLAITERYDDGSGSGYTYTARVDYDTGAFTYRLGG